VLPRYEAALTKLCCLWGRDGAAADREGDLIFRALAAMIVLDGAEKGFRGLEQQLTQSVGQIGVVRHLSLLDYRIIAPR
jgi:hypothetical protein